MYEQFFGFSQRPFAASPNPDCFVASTAMQETFLEVKHCLTDGRGIALLTAADGMGKTLFCHQLMKEMASEFQTAFLANAQFPTRRSFLQTVLYELGHGYIRQGEEEVRLLLKGLLAELQPPQTSVLLIIDEADHLSRRTLDEVRGLSNLIEGENPLVRILLCGPHSLEEKLILPENSACYQRVACQATLESLSIQESVSYIEYRLGRVGSSLEKAFHADALEAICQASDGVPRAINQLCDHSLMLGYLAEQSPVDLPTTLEALDDLKQLPLCWNEPAAAKQTYVETEIIEDVEEEYVNEDKITASIENDSPSIVTSEELQAEAASFEVGSFEVGAETTYDLPVETVYETETIQSVETSIVEEVIEVVEVIEIASPELSCDPETNTACFEVGAELTPLAEISPPTIEIQSEPTLVAEVPLVVEVDVIEEEEQPLSVFEEESAVEVVFDRYAMIDAGDPVSLKCINLTEVISEKLSTEVKVEISKNEPINPISVPIEDSIEIETEEVTAIEITKTLTNNIEEEDKLRDNLIQVCQETREAIGHQLNVLEEIWDNTHNDEETTETETYELENSQIETTPTVKLDIYSTEATDASAEEIDQEQTSQQKTAIDLTAMRQRLSQRFKQLRRKHG